MSTETKASIAERLFIHRRRTGFTQARAAAALGIPVHAYANIECGRFEASDYKVKAPKLGRIQPFQWAVLFRRRKAWTQVELARKLKCCRFHVNQMELDKVPNQQLLEFWGLTK